MNNSDYLEFEIVCATRFNQGEFWSQSPMAQSLNRLVYDMRSKNSVVYSNRKGLSEIYNSYIKTTKAKYIVFIHDDVRIDDFFFFDRVIEGLDIFDIIGVAGNKRRVDYQPSWYFKDAQFNKEDSQYLSGHVAHGKQSFGIVNKYGKVPASCKLIDGFFIATKVETLLKYNLRFDNQFMFHFYDMDFCRSAELKGVSIGTWPIALLHESNGSFTSLEWKTAYNQYITKWTC